MNNMQSYLMPGYYAKMASDKNMIGIVIDNSKSRVAPFGGIEPKLGANPIGLAIPTNNTAFVLDMATSTRAMGEVRLAKRLGKLLPDNMALDKEGNLTEDPNKVNALTPFGGYKGYGLCLAIEIIAGSFVRAKMGSKLKGSLDRGFLFLVINPEIFVDIKTFKDEVSELIKEIKSSKKASDFDEILIPGERALNLMKENLMKGYLEIDDKIVEPIHVPSWKYFESSLRRVLKDIGYSEDTVIIRHYEDERTPLVLSSGTDRDSDSQVWRLPGDFSEEGDKWRSVTPSEVTYAVTLDLTKHPASEVAWNEGYYTGPIRDWLDHVEDRGKCAIVVYDSQKLERESLRGYRFNGDQRDAVLAVFQLEGDSPQFSISSLMKETLATRGHNIGYRGLVGLRTARQYLS